LDSSFKWVKRGERTQRWSVVPCAQIDLPGAINLLTGEAETTLECAVRGKGRAKRGVSLRAEDRRRAARFDPHAAEAIGHGICPGAGGGLQRVDAARGMDEARHVRAEGQCGDRLSKGYPLRISAFV